MQETSGQKRLEEFAEKTLYENNVVQKDLINGMMRMETGGCSYGDRTLTFIFPVQPWQANRAGDLHGGMISTAFDITLAALARFLAGKNFAPTLSLDVKFIRPVSVGDTLEVTARATAAGRRITHLTGEAVSGTTGKLVASAATVYMNVDTAQERKSGK